jgi:hypothetical protein
LDEAAPANAAKTMPVAKYTTPAITERSNHVRRVVSIVFGPGSASTDFAVRGEALGNPLFF